MSPNKDDSFSEGKMGRRAKHKNVQRQQQKPLPFEAKIEFPLFHIEEQENKSIVSISNMKKREKERIRKISQGTRWVTWYINL